MESLAKFIKRAESTQYQRKYKRISIFLSCWFLPFDDMLNIFHENSSGKTIQITTSRLFKEKKVGFKQYL